jgi:hypothetical protein
MMTACLAAASFAAPPGPVDGVNIPSNFGAANLAALQRNHTGFGNYTVTTGALLEGSEANQLFVALSPFGGSLQVAITGNLSTNGNALLIGINTPGATGQTECLAQGVGGPPYTLQDTGRQIVVSDNGTPEDLTDDTWSYGATGMIFPCETDFVIAVDAFGGTASISEYVMLDPNGAGQGTNDPTPDNPNDGLQTLYAVRTFVTQGPTNDVDGMWDNDQFFGYGLGGFDNTNTAGVTSTDGSSAATANTGLELSIPLTRLGLSGTETIGIWVMVVDGAGGEGAGTVTNQVLPALTGGTACDPAGVLGMRPDMSAVMACASVDLTTATDFDAQFGVADGAVNAADYGGALATQTCPTPYGDQTFDPEGVTRTGGSELDALYLDADELNLYVGITGNLQENGNKILVWIDSVAGGVHSVVWDGMGAGGNGVEGDVLPPLASDTMTDALFDYVFQYNASGTAGSAPCYIDMWDLNAQATSYRGFSTMETGNGDLNLGGAAPNPWGMQLAVNNTNNDGVIGCGLFENPCWFDTSAQVEAQAATATSGSEIVIPLADIGLDPCAAPDDIHVWVLLTGNDGWRSNQALPSARGDGEQSVQNGANQARDWYQDPPAIIPESYYRAVAATITPPGLVSAVNDCNGNMIEDQCDILSMTSADANGSGVPDECEIGACCTAGVCSEGFEEDCAGTFQGVGTDCDTTECPQTGACCIGEFCSDVFEEDCTGDFQGEGTECATTECAEPTGACCRNDGTCAETVETGCAAYVCDVTALQGITCLGDTDGNGVVNAADRGQISANIGQTSNDLLCLFDLDGNGTINAADRGQVSANIGFCTALPNHMNGNGPDPRYSATWQGAGTTCPDDCN